MRACTCGRVYFTGEENNRAGLNEQTGKEATPTPRGPIGGESKKQTHASSRTRVNDGVSTYRDDLHVSEHVGVTCVPTDAGVN